MRIWAIAAIGLLSSASAASAQTIGVSATIEAAVESPNNVVLRMNRGLLHALTAIQPGQTRVLYKSEVTARPSPVTPAKLVASEAVVTSEGASSDVATADAETGSRAVDAEPRSARTPKPVLVTWTLASNS